MNDIRFAFRQLLKNPGFTAVAVLTLALGIGGATAIYSVINSTLLNPIPGPHANRLVQIAERMYTQGGFRDQNRKPFFCGVCSPVLEAMYANRKPFAQLAWANQVILERKTADFVEQDLGWTVSPNLFALWNVPPLLGRTFAKDEAVPLDRDERPARDTAIVISYAWWQSLFGGGPKVIAKTIALSGHRFTVIGVMPAQFQFPYGAAKCWLPAQPLRLPPGWMTGPNIRLFARLKPGATIQQAEAMLNVVAHRLATEPALSKTYGPDWRRRPGGLGFWVRPASEAFTDGRGDLERTLFGLLAAIGFVLLIVCANVANLTLARTERRQQELAIRAALGAGRARLTRQLLTESFLLAGLGAVGGVVVAAIGVKLLGALVPQYMPRLRALHVNGAALGFTLLICLFSGLAFGLVPAWQGARAKLAESLKQAAAQASAGRAGKRYRAGLVVVEFALTLVLLAGAGLMIDSVARLLHVNPGFDPENLLGISLNLPWDKYNDPEHYERATGLRKILYAQLEERLAALPGVKAVGIGKDGAWPEKLKMAGRSEPMQVLLEGCGVGRSDLFRAMRIPLLAGRYFGPDDVGVGVGTTIINETMARAFWPGQNAVGKRFGRRTSNGSREYMVVGVVGDVRDFRYNQQVRPAFYRPCYELGLQGAAPFLIVRTANDPRPLIPAIRHELKEVEPLMRAPRITLVKQVLYDSTQAQRTYMLFLVVFAAVGLLLACLGIYGVLACSVTRRTREIGIRTALGAERRQILWLVMADGARLASIGVAVGLLAAFWLTRLFRNQLFEVGPRDPVVFGGAVVLLLGVALLACYLPARRALRVKPMEALRYE